MNTATRRPPAPPARQPAPAPHGERLARARDGRGRKGQFRPSRHADGHGRRGDRAVHAVPQIRSAGAGLARPRPLRAVGRARLDAALRAAAPARLSRHDARRAEALPPARQPHRRPSRARPRHRHRDDDRAARPGSRQFGRHGARRAASRGRVRRRPRQSSYLRDLRRRLPDGGDQPRGDLAGRPSQAQQADRAVGRQFDHDRRQHQPVGFRRSARTRSARMAGRPSASTASTTTRSPPRSAGRRRTTGRA